MTNMKAAKILLARLECKRCLYRVCDECELCGEQGTFKELIDAVVMAVNALKKQYTEQIDYQYCSNAMLRMWIDNVVTDGEYNRIMDKLNAFWSAKQKQKGGNND